LQRELLGKDAAAKLLKQKQQKMRSNGLPAQQNILSKTTTNPRPVREEQSEDEDEGRAASFKSKRAKRGIPRVSDEHKDRPASEASSKKRPALEAEAAESDCDDNDEQQNASMSARNVPSGVPRKGAPSFLDEMLSEKAKKRRKKKKKQNVSQAL